MTTTFLAEFWTCLIDKKFVGVRAHPHHHNHHCRSHSQSSGETDGPPHLRLSGEGSSASKCHKRVTAEDSKNGRSKPGRAGSPLTGSNGSKPHIRNSPESGKDAQAPSDKTLFNVCYESSPIQKKGMFNRIFRRAISQNNNNCLNCDDNGEDGYYQNSGRTKGQSRREENGNGTGHGCLCCVSGSSCSDNSSDDSDIGSLFYLSSDEDSVNELLPEYFASDNTVISLEKSELPSARNILASACALLGSGPADAQVNGAVSPPSAVLIKEELSGANAVNGGDYGVCLLGHYISEARENPPSPVGDATRASLDPVQPFDCNNTKSESSSLHPAAAPPPPVLSASEQGNAATSPAENVPIPDNSHQDLYYVDPPKDIVGKTTNSGVLTVSEASGKALTVKCNVNDVTPVLPAAIVRASRPDTLPRSLLGAQILKRAKRSYIVGKGATAIVKLCDTIDTDKKYAIKEFRKRKKCETKREYIKKLVAEFCISSSLKNENIVSTIDLVQGDKHQWCVIMEYCPGGDLYTRINSGTLTSPSEINCYLKQLVNGVSYLHSMGVAHRDLKPENLLLNRDGSILKIADFGVSAVFRGPFCTNCRKTKGLCGSGPYISPEQFVQLEYDPRMADVWSTAIVYYVMVYWAAPWKDATNLDPRFKKYSENPSSYPPIQRLRPGPRSLILRMLDPDVSKRCDVAYILNHEWFKLIPVCSENPDPGRSPPTHEHFKLDHNDYY